MKTIVCNQCEKVIRGEVNVVTHYKGWLHSHDEHFCEEHTKPYYKVEETAKGDVKFFKKLVPIHEVEVDEKGIEIK